MLFKNSWCFLVPIMTIALLLLQRTEQLTMPKYAFSSMTSSRSIKGANPAPSELFICPICHEKHTSRNQLYKHWRISSACSSSNEFNYTLTPTTIRPKRIAAALLLGYTENAERCEKVVEKYLKSSEKDSIFLREFNNTRVIDKLVITRSSSSSFPSFVFPLWAMSLIKKTMT